LGKSRRVKKKRLAKELVAKYSEKITTDFEKNKELIDSVMPGVAKKKRNEVAGFLVSVLKKQTE
jgi:ribosomal protein S17E